MPAESVVVVPGVLCDALLLARHIDCVQVAVLQVFIRPPVPGICAAHHHLIELAAGGVSELRAELILQHGEVLHGVVWNGDVGAGHALVVVIDTLNHEVVVSRTLSTDRPKRSARCQRSSRADWYG